MSLFTVMKNFLHHDLLHYSNITPFCAQAFTQANWHSIAFMSGSPDFRIYSFLSQIGGNMNSRILLEKSFFRIWLNPSNPFLRFPHAGLSLSTNQDTTLWSGLCLRVFMINLAPPSSDVTCPVESLANPRFHCSHITGNSQKAPESCLILSFLKYLGWSDSFNFAKRSLSPGIIQSQRLLTVQWIFLSPSRQIWMYLSSP